MKIDSHHHFWNYSAEEYGWIGEGMGVLKKDFSPAELSPLLVDAGLDGVISVQARTDVKEIGFLCEYAADHDFIKGVVGWVDLTDGDAVTEQIAKFSALPKAKGVREVLQGMDDDEYCLREDFNAGLSRLHDFGLVYDILIFHRHLPHAIKMVDQHPNQVFVLDHIAKPDIQSATPDPIWAANMKELAKRENVFCKLSGVVTEVRADLECSSENLRPYFEIVLEAFGADRLMFGSDWPVCLLRSQYSDWVSCVETWTAPLTETERSQIWGATAQRAYSIDS